jgi:predicted O-methyltransferase YrrM
MSILYNIKHQLRLARIKPTRYRALIREIEENRCKSILEVGVFNGRNSLRMIESARVHHRASDIHYYGFDLFEMLTEKELKQEFSKMPLSEEQIYSKLSVTGAHIHLFKGYSQDTLKKFVEDNPDIQPDFIFIDGGHSIETIRSDWNNLSRVIRKNTVVLFDDYYDNTEEFILGKGCNELIEELDRSVYEVDVLDPVNEFEQDWGTLRVRFVKVTLK